MKSSHFGLMWGLLAMVSHFCCVPYALAQNQQSPTERQARELGQEFNKNIEKAEKLPEFKEKTDSQGLKFLGLTREGWNRVSFNFIWTAPVTGGAVAYTLLLAKPELDAAIYVIKIAGAGNDQAVQALARAQRNYATGQKVSMYSGVIGAILMVIHFVTTGFSPESIGQGLIEEPTKLMNYRENVTVITQELMKAQVYERIWLANELLKDLMDYYKAYRATFDSLKKSGILNQYSDNFMLTKTTGRSYNGAIYFDYQIKKGAFSIDKLTFLRNDEKHELGGFSCENDDDSWVVTVPGSDFQLHVSCAPTIQQMEQDRQRELTYLRILAIRPSNQEPLGQRHWVSSKLSQ